MRIRSGKSRRQWLLRARLWGFSLTQALVGLAILAVAASVFLPAFRIQCEAARRALQAGVAQEVVQPTTLQ